MKFQVLTTSLLLSLGAACPLPATTQPAVSPNSSSNNDFAGAAVGELIGYGAKTTGGAGGAQKTVTSCADLKSAVSGDSAKIVKISGMLKDCGIIDIGSNTSVLGVGSGSGFTGSGFRVKRKTNVIIQNLKLGPAPAGGDVLGIDSSTNIWIDHNEIKSLGVVGGKDDFDGLLDITHAADFVTISWNTFADHWKALLFGHSDSNAAEDTGKLHITVHHNSFTNINSRLPSVRFGTAHVFNNVYSKVGASGINSRMGAQVLSENNVFDNVKLAMVTDLDSKQPGKICSKGNVLGGTSTERITAQCSLTPPYQYKLDGTSSLKAAIASGAGVGKI